MNCSDLPSSSRIEQWCESHGLIWAWPTDDIMITNWFEFKSILSTKVQNEFKNELLSAEAALIEACLPSVLSTSMEL